MTDSISIEREQINMLKDFLIYVNKYSKFYQKLFANHNININNINTLTDLTQIPFTLKDDLAKYNDDFLCVEKASVADFVTTSGTLSEPVAFYLTKKDIERLANNEATALKCAGGDVNDIYQLMVTTDKQFMAGLAYYLGISKMGAGAIRVGHGSPYLQWESIKRFNPTILIAIPSFIPVLIDYAIEHNINFNKSSVKSIICIGEPIRNNDFTSNELGKKILSQWNVNLYSTYASTEMGAAFTECKEQKGGHLNPKLLILEVVDKKGKVVSNGKLGEVVVTTIGVEGMPLLRYKTGDLCNVYYNACKCGKTTTRLGPVVGRKQQMMKFKGTTLFPPAIFNVIDMVKEVELYQVEVAKDKFGNDQITVIFSDELDTVEFQKKITSLFKSKIKVTPYYRFIKKDILKQQVFKQENRKPNKLVYK